MDFFFFSSPALFENPLSDRNYCLNKFALYVEVGKGCNRLKNLSDSEIGFRFIHAEGKSYCSGMERRTISTNFFARMAG